MLVEGPIASLETLLNRQIEASTPARERLARLAGHSFAVAVQGAAGRELRLRFEAAREGLRLSLGETPAEANVRGSALGLLRLLSGREGGGHHQPGVTVEGDATIVQGFEQLFRHAKPDVEAELARLLGPTGGHYAFGAVMEWAYRDLAGIDPVTAMIPVAPAAHKSSRKKKKEVNG